MSPPPASTDSVVEVRNLTKDYGAFRALDDVSFSIGRGETVGLPGSNGAGKSTIILTMLGLISPTSGSIRAFGCDLAKHREKILSRTNFAAPYITFPGRLTVFENLMVFARIYAVPRPAEKIKDLLKRFEIDHYQNKPTTLLSSGQNTRLGICRALLNDPLLLLMDEPTAFLDPHVSRLVKEALTELRQRHGTSVLYTSHNMSEVEEMCSRVIFLSHGRVVAEGTPLELTRTVLREARALPALEEVFLRIDRAAR